MANNVIKYIKMIEAAGEGLAHYALFKDPPSGKAGLRVTNDEVHDDIKCSVSPGL